jgi:hypothetical protein
MAAGKKTVVIGPHSNAQGAMAGNYLGQLCPNDNFDCITSPFDVSGYRPCLHACSAYLTLHTDGCRLWEPSMEPA